MGVHTTRVAAGESRSSGGGSGRGGQDPLIGLVKGCGNGVDVEEETRMGMGWWIREMSVDDDAKLDIAQVSVR